MCDPGSFFIPMNDILLGDIRDIAKTLPAQLVNCIVTSPPYFGLRDYQTAKWEGGKADCDHAKDRSNGITSSTLGGGKSTTNHQQEVSFRDTCPKCGAKRIDKQIGLEATPEAYVNTLVGIFRELKRVLRDDGSVWLNLGDSYAANRSYQVSDSKWQSHEFGRSNKGITPNGLKPKNLIGIPWRVAFALQADGWILRSDIIWHKKNPMPESVKDRPTKAHEYIFLLSKKPRYYYDNEAVREDSKPESYKRYHYAYGGEKAESLTNSGQRNDGFNQWRNPQGRNRRSVWTVSTRPYKAAHFAVFPPDLIRPCILAGCPQQVCGECGEPWGRVVEKKTFDRKNDNIYGNGIIPNYNNPNGKVPGSNTRGMPDPDIKTIGFVPACQCNADTKPGVVLDPFMGSGTVAQVAIETGRNWLGVELNPEYIELAMQRINGTQIAIV